MTAFLNLYIEQIKMFPNINLLILQHKKQKWLLEAYIKWYTV
jgi:hypothetical protein